MLYRFEHDGIGIYEAIDKFCPRDDPRRANKPDGSWLPKVGTHYPAAISFWTDAGLERYQSSGLLAWHLSVLPNEATVKHCALIGELRYQDEFQVITDVNNVRTLKVALASYYLSSIR